MKKSKGFFTSDIVVQKRVNPCFGIILSSNLHKPPCNYNIFLDGLYENAPLFNEITFL